MTLSIYSIYQTYLYCTDAKTQSKWNALKHDMYTSHLKNNDSSAKQKDTFKHYYESYESESIKCFWNNFIK